MARWEGVGELTGALERMEEKAGEAMGRALRQSGEEIMTDVKAARPGKGVPVDRGDLRNSGQTTGPKKTGRTHRVELSFGGPAAPYALRQHEDLTYQHTVGEARYLVRGWERHQAGFGPEQAIKEQVAWLISQGKVGLSVGGAFDMSPAA